MNPKTTVILLVVFLLAVAGAIYLSQKPTPIVSQEASRNAALNDTTRDAAILDAQALGPSVKQFIIYLNEDTIDAKSYDGQWLVTRPHMFPCNTAAIDEILGVLGNLQGTLIDQTDLIALKNKTYDGVGNMFGQPERFITLNPGEDPITIRLHQRLGAGRGGISTVIDKTFTFYNADDTLHDLFEAIDLYSFYPRSIKPLLMPETRRVEITTGEATSVLTQENGQWLIGEGRNAERALEMQLDRHPGINNYFALLKAIEIQDFHPYERDAGLEPFGLHKPLLTARFVPIDGKPNNRAVGKMLRVGVPADPADQTRFACYSRATDHYPLVFTIPTPIALAFGQDATAFRDPRIIDLAPALIGRIEVMPPHEKNGPLREYVFLFEIDSPPKLIDDAQELHTLSPEACRSMLAAMNTPQAISYKNKEPQASQKISAVIVRSRLGGNAQSFGIFADPDSSAEKPTVLVQRGDEPVTLRVPSTAVAGLLDPTLLIAQDEE